MTTIMTEEARRAVQFILYGEEPLTFLELIFRPGFIRLMLIVWSPVIVLGLLFYIIHLLEKRSMKVIEDKENNNVKGAA